MDLINFSVCLSDIPKEKMTKSEKNGKMYVNLTARPNKNGADKFGNDFSISVMQTKDERDSKAQIVYVGNGKSFTFNNNSSTKQVAHDTTKTNVAPSEDLPF